MRGHDRLRVYLEHKSVASTVLFSGRCRPRWITISRALCDLRARQGFGGMQPLMHNNPRRPRRLARERGGPFRRPFKMEFVGEGDDERPTGHDSPASEVRPRHSPCGDCENTPPQVMDVCPAQDSCLLAARGSSKACESESTSSQCGILAWAFVRAAARMPGPGCSGWMIRRRFAQPWGPWPLCPQGDRSRALGAELSSHVCEWDLSPRESAVTTKCERESCCWSNRYPPLARHVTTQINDSLPSVCLIAQLGRVRLRVRSGWTVLRSASYSDSVEYRYLAAQTAALTQGVSIRTTRSFDHLPLPL